MVFIRFVFVEIMWFTLPNFLNGGCEQLNEKAHFVQKKCTSVTSNSFEAPQINSCLTMSTYHYAFGPEDVRLEDLVVDKV